MKLWKDLPTEILENIFTFINDSDQIYTTRKQNLFQCELVCRQWKPAAKHLAYSDITLTSEESTQTLIAMAREDQGQSFGELVRCIHFKLTPSPQYYAVYVPNLMTLFPFVEHITAQDPTKQLYQVLDTTSKNWTRLQTISRPIDLESLPYYGSFALKYCQSLTTVFIGDNTVSSLYESITPDTQSWNRVLQNLNQFPNLEQLDIQNLSESGLDSFDSVIEQCPTTLQSLGFRILRESLARAGTAPIRAIHLSPIAKRTLLRKINGKIMICNENTLNYIMHKFPNLDSLHINCDDCGRFFYDGCMFIEGGENKQRFFFSSTTVANFISFVSRIPSHNIWLQLPVSSLNEILSKQQQNLVSVSLSYEDNCPLFYQISRMDDFRTSTLHMSSDTSSNTNSIGVTYNSKDFDLRPHLLLIQNCGQKIHSLSASNGSTRDLDLDSHPFEVEQVLQHCTNLRQFTISRSILSIPKLKSSATNYSITDLALQEVVMMNRNELKELSQKLPSLKNMVIHDCMCRKYDTTVPSLETTNVTLDMPYSSFDSLDIKDSFVSGGPFRDNLYLKVCKRNIDSYKSTFYKSEHNDTTSTYKMVRCSEQDYGLKRLDMNYVNFRVNCTAIKKIKIIFQGIQSELVF